MPIKDYIVDLIGLGATAGISYGLYCFLRASKSTLENLKETPELDINTDLVSLVSKNGGSMLACVRGVVQATDGSIRSLAHPEVTGVIWRHTIKEHLIAQVMGVWMKDDRTIDSTLKTVPFMLMKNGIGIQIADPNKLDNIDLSIVTDKFDAASNSLTDHLWGWMKGVRSTGTQQTEEMLVEGTSLLGIGNLVLRQKALYLDHSSKIPYILTKQDKLTVIDDIESHIPVVRVLVFISAFGTAFYCYRMLIRWYRQWRKDAKRRAEERILEEARLQREAQNNDLPESLMCVICCDLRDVILMPCKHVCVCSECALKLSPRVCPVCRTEIDTIQPVFFS
ncbi:mitochondrial E3 ubiquitin protein ligase 1-like [Palaemon carinicauda]|uniref:mitochondrial E3 ubiquitin protein ligase 1-like n=1 Tax=Palaemon carinicauda TaxID=392227 RepID=UPI0035B671B5